MFSLVAHTEMHGFDWVFSYFWHGTGRREQGQELGFKAQGPVEKIL